MIIRVQKTVAAYWSPLVNNSIYVCTVFSWLLSTFSSVKFKKMWRLGQQVKTASTKDILSMVGTLETVRQRGGRFLNSPMNTLGITDCSNPSTQIQMTYILHVCYLRSDLETTEWFSFWLFVIEMSNTHLFMYNDCIFSLTIFHPLSSPLEIF